MAFQRVSGDQQPLTCVAGFCGLRQGELPSAAYSSFCCTMSLVSGIECSSCQSPMHFSQSEHDKILLFHVKKRKKETWQPCFSHSIISIKHINHIQNELILILLMNVHQYISWLLMSMYHYISLLSINVHHYASWWLMNVCQYISWLVLVTNVCHYVSWLLMTVHHYMSWLLMNGHHYISWKFCSEFFH